jgi:hypothetical protein
MGRVPSWWTSARPARLAPIFHRVLYRFHVESGKDDEA